MCQDKSEMSDILYSIDNYSCFLGIILTFRGAFRKIVCVYVGMNVCEGHVHV